MELDESFWSSRYKSGEIQWDIGAPSTPLKTYIDQLSDKNLRILIPGGGNGYEAEYLHRLGFKHVFLLDISEQPLLNFASRVPDFPKEHLLNEDFFQHKGQYDLILEQTFFCAMLPSFRQAYVEKMSELLISGGKLVGLLFDAPMYDYRPPYGGTKEDYLTLFSTHFDHVTLDACYNSIPPRSGTEVFIKAQKS